MIYRMQSPNFHSIFPQLNLKWTKIIHHSSHKAISISQRKKIQLIYLRCIPTHKPWCKCREPFPMNCLFPPPPPSFTTYTHYDGGRTRGNTGSIVLLYCEFVGRNVIGHCISKLLTNCTVRGSHRKVDASVVVRDDELKIIDNNVMPSNT